MTSSRARSVAATARSVPASSRGRGNVGGAAAVRAGTMAAGLCVVRRAAARSPLVWLIAGPPVVAWPWWRAAGRGLPRAVRVCYGSSLGFLAARAPDAWRQGGRGPRSFLGPELEARGAPGPVGAPRVVTEEVLPLLALDVNRPMRHK